LSSLPVTAETNASHVQHMEDMDALGVSAFKTLLLKKASDTGRS
jgi:hypothetical protein